MLSDPWFYAAAIPAVALVGFSKGGFGGGLALVGVPMMALVIPPFEAAAIMLPIMVVMDIIAMQAWWGIYDRRTLFMMMPASIAGIVLGWFVAASVTDGEVRLIVGIVAVAFTLNYWLRGRLQKTAAPQNTAKAWFWGIISGFTSFVSHAGGPPAQMYLLPLRLDPKVLVGTMVLMFAAINFIKLVPYAMLGEFSSTNLMASAVLLPVAPVATYLGARLVKVISPPTFYRFTYVTLFLIGLKLLWDGVASVI